MKYSTVKRQRSSGVKTPVAFRPSKQNNPTAIKYRNASGEREPICGSTLEALEKKLNAIEQTKNEKQAANT
jgi:hypothetical protein